MYTYDVHMRCNRGVAFVMVILIVQQFALEVFNLRDNDGSNRPKDVKTRQLCCFGNDIMQLVVTVKSSVFRAQNLYIAHFETFL